MVLPTCQPIFTVLVQFLDRNRKPHLNQMQHVPVDHSPGDTLHQFAVWSEQLDPLYKEYRAASRRHRAWVFSLVAPAVVDTSYCVTPLGSRSTTSPILSIRYLRSFAHLL